MPSKVDSVGTRGFACNTTLRSVGRSAALAPKEENLLCPLPQRRGSWLDKHPVSFCTLSHVGLNERCSGHSAVNRDE